MTGKDTKLMPQGYKDFLLSIKRRIHESRIRAYNVVNRELIELYWGIGRDIAERQERDGWGKSVVERLSQAKSPTACWRNTLGTELTHSFQGQRYYGAGVLSSYDGRNGLEPEYSAKLPKPGELGKQILQELGNGENDAMTF